MLAKKYAVRFVLDRPKIVIIALNEKLESSRQQNLSLLTSF